MKNTIKWLEKKIGKHDTNLLIFAVSEFGLITSVFFFHYSNLWLSLYLPSVFLMSWAFERVNKHSPKKGEKK